MNQVWNQLVDGFKNTTWVEFVAVAFGIASVVYSRLENILVFPTGLVNTILYTWLCFAWWGLYAEASLNFYYTVMSIYGWILWTRKDGHKEVRKIMACSKKENGQSMVFFFICWGILYLILSRYTKSTVPLADSFASAAAYTGMWLMARKKLENWIWWIITNLASIPLYFYKGAVFTSFQYLVFLVLAVMGYLSWRKKLPQHDKEDSYYRS